MSYRLRLACAGVLAPAATAPPVHGTALITHHQVIAPRLLHGTGVDERVSFDAFGRHYELQLTPNERIRRSLPQSQRSITPLRGTIAGLPGSWVRLTSSGSGYWEGML